MLRRHSLLARIGGPLVAAVVLTLLATAAPASASHGGAHTLIVYSLTCWAQNDPSGDDEPYLKLAGNRIWEHPDCYPVHTYNINQSWTFWNETDLYIMEDDFGSDDTVGWVRVGPQAGQGTLTYFSYKNGVAFNYQLVYQVI